MKTKTYSTPDLIARYGRTDSFGVVDTIGVPHPFTVGVKHVKFAADCHGGVLNERVCRKIPCAHRGCTLSYDEHQTALLVECLVEPAKALKEIQTYLQSIVPLCEDDGFVGFTLLDKFSGK